MNVIKKFITFAQEIQLKTLFIDNDPKNYYVTIFSYVKNNTNGILCSFYWENQFDTAREYWYHDALTHGRNILDTNSKILVIWWGDFMNFRFLKKFDVTLVDIDSFVTDLFSKNPLCLSLNHFEKIENYNFFNSDGVKFILENQDKKFNHIILDLPVFFSNIDDEIKWYWLERFFTRDFFIGKIFNILSSDWLLVMQADDNIIGKEHYAYFQKLIEWSGIFMHKYSLDFVWSDYKQYFLVFSRFKNKIDIFIKSLPKFEWQLWLFNADEYFIWFQEEFLNGNISFEEYKKILLWL